MPDPNTPSLAAPDTSAAPIAVVAVPSPVVAPTSEAALLSPREAIAQKYEQLYGGTPATQPDPVIAAPAQGDPLATTPDPVVVPPTPDPAPPDRMAQMEAQLAQVTNILTQLAQPRVETPATPAPVVQKSFFDLLKEGDLDGAEAALANKAAAAAESSAVAKAVEMVRVENDVTQFIATLRRENPDLMPLEELITARAAQKLDIVQKSGKVKSVPDYLREYKAAVNEAAADARKIVQSIRAAGKTDAMTTIKQVVSASTITPNPVESNRGPIAPNAPETVDDYLAKRTQANYRMRGLAVS